MIDIVLSVVIMIVGIIMIVLGIIIPSSTEDVEEPPAQLQAERGDSDG